MTLDREDAVERADRAERGAKPAEPAGDLSVSRTSSGVPASVLALASVLPAVLVASWVLAGLPLVALHVYRPAPAIVLGLVVFAVIGRPVVRAAHDRARSLSPVPWWVLVAVLAVVIGFGVLAFATSASDVVVRRDPGSYSVSAFWLANHGTVEMPAHAASFGGASPNLVLVSQGFYQQGSHIVPQFMTGVPILLAIGGWINGITGILHVNAFIGAFALLAFAGLVARLVAPAWAPLAVLTLALAQPVLDTMRATYSEPAAQLLMIGGLVVVIDALHVTGSAARAARVRRWALLVGGLVLGSVSLVRIDAAADVLPIVPFVGWLAYQRQREWRYLAGGVVLGLLAGAFDCVFLTWPYTKYVRGSLALVAAGFVVAVPLTIICVRAAWAARSPRSRPPRAWPEVSLIAGLAVAVLVGAALPFGGAKAHVLAALMIAGLVVIGWALLRAVWWRQSNPDRARSARWPGVAALGVFLVGLFFFLRPHLMTMRAGAGSGGAAYVGLVQQGHGLAYDPTRSYYENATRWLSWYVGWATLALALAAAIWLAYEQVKGRRREWLPVFLVFLGMTAAVLAKPQITPDHPWADRRFVPVVYPAIAALAFAAVAWAFARVGRLRLPIDAIRAVRTFVVALAIAAIVVPTWVGSRQVFTATTEQGEVALTHDICARLQPGDAVVAFGAAGTSVWPGTVRVMCGVGVGYLIGPDPQVELTRIAAAAQARGGRLMIFVDGTVTGDRAKVPGQVDWQPALQLTTTEVAHTLIKRPDDVQHNLTFEIWIGQWLGPQG